jgi:hypothetical protein
MNKQAQVLAAAIRIRSAVTEVNKQVRLVEETSKRIVSRARGVTLQLLRPPSAIVEGAALILEGTARLYEGLNEKLRVVESALPGIEAALAKANDDAGILSVQQLDQVDEEVRIAERRWARQEAAAAAE